MENDKSFTAKYHYLNLKKFYPEYQLVIEQTYYQYINKLNLVTVARQL